MPDTKENEKKDERIFQEDEHHEEKQIDPGNEHTHLENYREPVKQEEREEKKND